MSTLREHLEAIRYRCRPIPAATPAEHQAHEHAVAALALLDNADSLRVDPIDGELTPDTPAWSAVANPFLRVRLIPDPDQPIERTPRWSATPIQQITGDQTDPQDTP